MAKRQRSKKEITTCAQIDGADVEACNMYDIQEALEELAPLDGSYVLVRINFPAHGFVTVGACREDRGNAQQAVYIAQVKFSDRESEKIYRRRFTSLDDLIKLYRGLFNGEPPSVQDFEQADDDILEQMSKLGGLDEIVRLDVSMLQMYRTFSPGGQPKNGSGTQSGSGGNRDEQIKIEQEAYRKMNLAPLERVLSNVDVGRLRKISVVKLIEIAGYFYGRGDYEAALTRYMRTAVLLDGTIEAADIFHQIGGCYFHLGNNRMKNLSVKKAIEIIRANSAAMDKDDALMRSAFEYKSLGLNWSYIACLDEISDRKNIEWLGMRYAEAYSCLKEHDAAIKWLTKVVKRSKLNTDAYWLLGWNYACLGQICKAIKCLESVRKLDGYDQRVLLELGALYIRQNRFNEAIECYQSCVRHFDKINSKDRWIFHMILGYVYITRQKKRRALKVMQQAYDEKFHEPGMLRNMAYCLRRLGRTDDANAIIQEADVIKKHLQKILESAKKPCDDAP